MKKTSLWKDNAEASRYPFLQEDLNVDVAIIGGGITGITAAYLLANAGKSVAVLEARDIGGITTGFSTGNLYATVGEMLKKLQLKFDTGTIHAVAASRTAAVQQIENIIHGFSLECDFHRRPWRLLSETGDNDKLIEKEHKACLDAGLDAHLDNTATLPFNISKALRVEGQAQFNPMQYVKALAARIHGTGCTLFENTPVIRITEGSPNILHTENGAVTFDLRAERERNTQSHNIHTRAFGRRRTCVADHLCLSIQPGAHRKPDFVHYRGDWRIRPDSPRPYPQLCA